MNAARTCPLSTIQFVYLQLSLKASPVSIQQNLIQVVIQVLKREIDTYFAYSSIQSFQISLHLAVKHFAYFASFDILGYLQHQSPRQRDYRW